MIITATIALLFISLIGLVRLIFAYSRSIDTYQTSRRCDSRGLKHGTTDDVIAYNEMTTSVSNQK